MSSATVHPEIQPEEGFSGDKTEPLIDHAPVIHAKGETQGEDSPQKTEVSAEIVPLAESPDPEGAEIERSVPDAGPVVHSKSQPGEESRRDDCEQLLDQAPVIHTEGLAQEKAPEKLGAPVGDVPLTEAPGPEAVEMERSGEDTKPSGEASPAAQSAAPPAEVCEANPVGTEEENASKSSAPPPPPPAAATASVPPAVPVVEEAPSDNSKYQNLQHYSYTPYTFVDSDLELSKSRLPQPSAGRPSPRH
ncbi:hypothetical protein XELAEV_18014499mg [Xenopus laevis]|nr:hypothetical protein XELAEV_18014499mg [Xenopus laevis]